MADALEKSRDMKRSAKTAYASHVALITLFAASILVPTAAKTLRYDPVAFSENRVLAALPAPPTSIEALKAWPDQFDKFCDDHFGLRNTLIYAHNLIRREKLRVSSDDVLIGKNGWLYYSGQWMVDDYLGRKPMQPDELQRFRMMLEYKQMWLEKRGIHFLFVVVPEKHAVYPENLPDNVLRFGAVSRRQRLINYIEQNSDIDTLDLTDFLTKNKNQGLLYYPVDFHWTARGKLLGCQEICRQMQDWFPDIDVCGMDDFTPVERPEWGGLIRELGLHRWSGLPFEGLIPKEHKGIVFEGADFPKDFRWNALWDQRAWTQPKSTNCKGKSARMLLFGDSMMSAGLDGQALMPFARSFSHCLFVQIRPDLALQKAASWPGGFNGDSPMSRPDFDDYVALVNSEHPDVVIEEWTERSLTDPQVDPRWHWTRVPFGPVTQHPEAPRVLAGEAEPAPY